MTIVTNPNHKVRVMPIYIMSPANLGNIIVMAVAANMTISTHIA